MKRHGRRVQIKPDGILRLILALPITKGLRWAASLLRGDPAIGQQLSSQPERRVVQPVLHLGAEGLTSAACLILSWRQGPLSLRESCALSDRCGTLLLSSPTRPPPRAVNGPPPERLHLDLPCGEFQLAAGMANGIKSLAAISGVASLGR